MVGLRGGWIKDRKNLYGFVKQALLRCKRACIGNTRQTLLQRVESKWVTQVLFSSVTEVSFSVSYKGTAPAD